MDSSFKKRKDMITQVTSSLGASTLSNGAEGSDLKVHSFSKHLQERKPFQSRN
jgi:hypothetical protein